MRGVDRELAVVALDEAIPGLHDPAVGVGEVALRPRRRTRRFAPTTKVGAGSEARGRGARRTAMIDHARGRAGLGVWRRRVSLRLGLERCLGRPDALEPRLLVGDPVRQLVAAHLGAMLGVLGGVSGLRLGQPALDLGRERRLGRCHPAIAHRLVLARVGLELGAVERDVAKPDQPRLPAQPQDLHEQRRQRRQMALPEVADGAEIRPLQAGHRHDVEPLLAAPGDPPRGVDALGVGIEQQRHHHRRVVGRLAALLPLVGLDDRRKVQLAAHQLAHQMRRMARRHEVVDRRRQQPDLIHVPRPKGLAHRPNPRSCALPTESPQYLAVERNLNSRTGS